MEKAKLVCRDGTEVEISDETEENLREQFGKKKEFAPITSCCLEISVSQGGGLVCFKSVPLEHKAICSQSIGEAEITIKAIQSVIDYIETK